MTRRQTKDPELSVGTIAACKAGRRYLGEWIIMETTGRDRYDCPTGQVLFHSPSEEEASEEFGRLAPTVRGGLFKFYGEKWVHTGKLAERLGKEFAEEANRVLKQTRDAR